MKNLLDYLKENGKAECGNYEFILLENGNVEMKLVLTMNEKYMDWKEKEKHDKDGWWLQRTVSEIVDATGDDNLRFCDICGKPMDAGFMSEDGGYHCCYHCFEDDMDETYGKGNWRANDDEDSDCCYEYLGEDGEWKDTTVFYTEWY